MNKRRPRPVARKTRDHTILLRYKERDSWGASCWQEIGRQCGRAALVVARLAPQWFEALTNTRINAPQNLTIPERALAHFRCPTTILEALKELSFRNTVETCFRMITYRDLHSRMRPQKVFGG